MLLVVTGLICGVGLGLRAEALQGVGAQSAGGEEGALRARLLAVPDDATAAQSLAELLERTGRGRAALVWRRRVLAEAKGGPAEGQATLELGVALVEAKRLSEAIPLLRSLTEREPANEPAEVELGTALARDEQFAAAFEAFARAAKLNPKDAVAQLSAAKALVTLLRYAEAEPYLEAAVAAGAKGAEVHGLRGVVEAHAGREAAALGEFAAALALNPDDAATQLQMGETLRGMGRVREAIGPLTRSAELAPSVAAYFQLARSYRALGEVEKERAAEARRQQVESDVATGHRIAALEAEASRDADAGDFGKAAESYRAALRLRPKDADLLYRAALVEGQRHEAAEEKRLLQQVLSVTADDAAAMAELGTIEGMQGDTKAAEQHLRRAVQADPQNGVALRNLAVLRAQAGDLEGAATLLTSAVESDPQDASSFRSLGLVLAALGRMREAETALRTSDTLGPGEGATATALGQMYLSEGRTAEGLAALRRAVAERPTEVGGHLLLARALLKTGDAAGASEETRRVLALEPGSSQGLALKEELCRTAGSGTDLLCSAADGRR